MSANIECCSPLSTGTRIDISYLLSMNANTYRSFPLSISISTLCPFGRRNKCQRTVYPKKYAHGFCFAVLCCGYALTDFPISIRLTSLALWQSNDCPSASKATLMNMDKYFMWIHYERLHNHNKAKHNKSVCIFLGIYCTSAACQVREALSKTTWNPKQPTITWNSDDQFFHTPLLHQK